MRHARATAFFAVLIGGSWVWACGDDTASNASGADASVDVTPGATPDATTAGDASVDDSPSADAGRVFDGGIAITEFAIAADAGAPIHPREIVVGPDGNLWFTQYDARQISRITPAGVITEFPVQASYLEGIAVGSDGALWFADLGAAHVGRMTTSGEVTFFPTAADAAAAFEPYSVTRGPDDNLWISAFGGPGIIAKMTTGGAVVDFELPDGAADGLRGIGTGPGGIWYGPSNDTTIGIMALDGGVTFYPVPDGGAFNGPFRVTAGPDGNEWYTRYSPGAIGRVTPSGVVTEFPVPTPSPGVTTLTFGADGNLWFAEYDAAKIGRMTASGVVTEFPLPDGAKPFAVTPGPNDTVWFTEYGAGKIGVITLQ